MRRRAFITAMGVSATAGCMGMFSDDSLSPTFYSDYSSDELTPPKSLLEGEWSGEWTETNLGDYRGEVYLKDDWSHLAAWNAEVHESEESAKEYFTQTRESEEFSITEDIDLSRVDEAFIGSYNGGMSVLFRHQNAVGQTVASERDGDGWIPDRELAERMARMMVGFWIGYTGQETVTRSR